MRIPSVRAGVMRTVSLAGEAASTIRGNPLRAGLAALAIGAAVATVSVIMTALAGVERSARQTSVRAFGSDTFVIARVFPGQLGRRELADRLARNPILRRREARLLERYAGGEVIYAPVAQRAADVTAGGRRFENAAISGTVPALAELRDLAIARGRFLAETDDRAAAQVVVIGADLADALFSGSEPIGGSVRIAGRGFTVVGVQARQGSAGGVSLDRYAWIPLGAFERAFGASDALQVFARGAESGRYVEAEDRARLTLRAARSLQPGDRDTFDLLSPEASRSFIQRLSERIGAAALPISAMALLAAIVVVTNTMLVSVAQRTREIGIRRAVGGGRRDVVVEVLAESGMIAALGGAVGLAAATVILRLAGGLLEFPLPLEMRTVAWSLLAAAASGLTAGWYPARRAARLDVVAALHQD